MLLALFALALAPAPMQTPTPDQALEEARQFATRLAVNPTAWTQLAIAAMAAERPDDAIMALSQTARLGGTVDLSLPEFSALRSRSEMAPVADRLTENGRARGDVRQAFELDSGAAVEGMAFVAGSREFLFANLQGPAIIRRRADGSETATPIAAASAIIGIRPDEARQTLWACAIMRETGHALLELDLGTFALRRSYAFPDNGGTFLCNDVETLPDGRAVATDTQAGRLWITGQGVMVPLTQQDSLSFPNGLVRAEDGRHLYVATATGIMRVEVMTAAVQPVRLGSDQTAASIDGLYRRGNILVGIQNAIRPRRIVRIGLDPSGLTGSLEVLAIAPDAFEQPTTGALIGNDLLFVANAQFRKVDRGVVRPGETLDPIRVLGVRAID